MKDLIKHHYVNPEDTDLRLLFLTGVGNNTLRKTGFYEIQWDKYYLSDGCTEVHPICWSYLNDGPNLIGKD